MLNLSSIIGFVTPDDWGSFFYGGFACPMILTVCTIIFLSLWWLREEIKLGKLHRRNEARRLDYERSLQE